MPFVVTYLAEDVKRHIKGLGGLTKVAERMGRILAADRDEQAPADVLQNIIGVDKSIRDGLLRVANSTAFGHPGQITDISQAILFLGFERIKYLAVGMTAMGFFHSRRSTYMDNLWIHGYEVGFIASALAGRIPDTQAGKCFLAGLLHDSGRILFYTMNQETSQKIETSESMSEQEIASFGCTHGEAGAWFAEATGLPADITVAISRHHTPSTGNGTQGTSAAVALAEALSKRFGGRPEEDGSWTDGHEKMLKELSLTDGFIESIGDRLASARPEIEGFFFTT